MRFSKRSFRFFLSILIFILVLASPILFGQVTIKDYQRVDRFANELAELVYYGDVEPHWIEETNRFWYRNYIPQGKEFVVIDADKKKRLPAFNHEKLAASLSRLTTDDIKATNLPFDQITFDPKANIMKFVVKNVEYICNLKNYKIERGAQLDPTSSRRGRRRERRSGETLSPDGQWYAFISDYNLFIRSKKTGEEYQLSYDGVEDQYYSEDITWASDSQKLATYFTTKGEETTVYLIESSPEDQLRPKLSSRSYALPGDILTSQRPTVFFVDNKPPFKVHESLIENAYSVNDIQWQGDNRHFTFRYHQRGEKMTKIVRVDAFTGKFNTVLVDSADTFIDRYNLIVRYVNEGREIIWSSERDGWRHLYLYDAVKGELKNRITQGAWVVHSIEYIDEKAGQIYFSAGGKEPGQDPYFIHYYRVNFDGSGLERLSDGNGSHKLSFSPDYQYYVDTWSRVDYPPISLLKRTSDGEVIMELEKADISNLLKIGWRMPEPFVAKGRDGETDIYGVIYRPSHFDESKLYPVIENIYAGPHGSFTPKTFRANRSDQALAELGFILVQMDGMGTANRSKAFHDVAWKNVGDAGFPDRIAWIKAAAKKYPYMDITRVGIYGTSAGGQSSTGALLFYPDFYTVAVSSCGCHDNRMDKAVWNEQWMGYPVGTHYVEQSNSTNAHKLKGKLLLIVGEMDTNVPPQSTFQVVDALIKAKKDFDLVFLPGEGHSGGGKYGERRRRDYFVKHLLGEDPPDWNNIKLEE